jgi:hypothetical protein
MRCVGVTVSVLLSAGLLFGAPAAAGPWARDAGSAFVSLRIAAEESQLDMLAGLWEPETYVSAYGELGLGRNLTLGADIGGGETSRLAVSFLRYTLTPPDATWQFAVDAGFGARQLGEEDPRALLRLGASVGRGFGEGGGGAWYMPFEHDGGWAVLDAVILYDTVAEAEIWQLESTFGLRLSDRFAGTLSVKAEEWPGSDLLISVSPSVIYELLPGTSLRVGGRMALEGSDAVGLSLALWHEF